MKNRKQDNSQQNTKKAIKVSNIDFSKNVLLQSPYLNIQAAGSMGNDSSKGIHLRWFLDGYLGENHIPKGDYAKNGDFYNKRQDYVSIYRALFDESDFELADEFDLNQLIGVNNKLRLWTVKSNQNNIFHLYFKDIEKYSKILGSIPKPENNRFKFFEEYDGELELEMVNKLFFGILFRVDGEIKFSCETISINNKSNVTNDEIVSSRNEYFLKNEEYEKKILYAENIKSLKFRIDSGRHLSIRLLTYDAFFNAKKKEFESKPNLIGNFALTSDDHTAFRRLENFSSFDVHGFWSKFNDDAFVNIENYKDRWSRESGLKDGVSKYIELSNTDPSATVFFDEEGNINDSSTIDISLQQFLNIASSDFHIARMLGMGHIDSQITDEKQKWIYLARYQTLKSPENYEIPLLINHIYMSLPTSMLDERLPEKLKLIPISYGLKVDNGTDVPLEITDIEGYAPFDPIRYVNLKTAAEKDYGITSQDFFNPPVEFNSSEFSFPISVGFEFKKFEEINWRKPEILHETDYVDTKGTKETKTVFLNDDNKPNYIHQVTEEGINVYSAYPVNIFSRAGELSNEQSTDKTTFKKPNTLKAPTNITVQLIQAENPLLLTAQSEQEWLKNIDPEKTEIFCRLTFDYTHDNDLNYRYGNKVRIFHKKNLPLQVIGSIQSIDDDDNNPYCCILSTSAYTYNSTGESFIPKIETNKIANFVGGILSYKSINYVIEEIILTNSDGSFPKIKIRKIEKRVSNPVSGGNQLNQNFEAPLKDNNVGFLVVENLSKDSSWVEDTNNRFDFEVNLGLPDWLEKIEKVKDSEENLREEKLRGIWDTATITKRLDSQNNFTGYYDIVFDSKLLNNHPQYISPDNNNGLYSVNWYRGVIRIHKNSDTLSVDADGNVVSTQERKVLKVEHILELNTGNKLKLLVYDSNFDSTEHVKLGSNISVSYHPGYRVYLRKNDSIFFNKYNVLPSENEGKRNTLIGLQTIDTTTLDNLNEVYRSPMSVPALLVAREIIQPKKPRIPVGPSFTNPPDFYNKANYSFETEFEHKPWGLTFFRIDNLKILSCLYRKETIEQILQSLPPSKDDTYLGNRWLNLLSFDYDDNNGEFEEFPINEQGGRYKFPNPDRVDIFIQQYTKPSEVVNIIKDAIFSNLLPLTEQPLIFQYIKGGNYVPTPNKQKVTDGSGNVLTPTHTDFDQAPMAKKISDTKVLFTDFTLDGNMSSEILYFYVVRELSNSMQMGEPSDFRGPVKLLNTKAPEKLNVRKLNIQIGSVSNNFENAVVFEVGKISKNQEISKIRILRTTNPQEALSPRSMNLAGEFAVKNMDQTTDSIILKDEFTGLEEIPFGVPIYYRLVGVREIDYKDFTDSPKSVSIFSEATNTLLSNVIDMKSPETPNLKVESSSILGDFIQLVNFEWDKTCINGIYTLQMLKNNVWQNIYKTERTNINKHTFSYNCDLPVLNEFGEKIYYKFKVVVENSAGLFNKEERITVL